MTKTTRVLGDEAEGAGSTVGATGGRPDADEGPASGRGGLEHWATRQPGRCTHGWHTSQRSIHDCAQVAPIAPDSELAVFVAALRTAARPDGLIHQTDVRPLIQAIPHKHRGLLYRQARLAGLIDLVDKEPSTDAAGRNTDKDQKVYRLRSAA